MKTQALVIGSGAGGSVTALELARAGMTVAVLEEGLRHDPARSYARGSAESLRLLYRRRGMTPILGSVPIGYVEGMCVGGSTEVNSGFWQRTPAEVLLRWRAQFELDGASPEEILPHFEWAEEQLGVSLSCRPWPKSTALFARGAERLGYDAREVPRAARNCQGLNSCAAGCPTGAKQGMSNSLLPQAEAAGAKIVDRARVKRLLAKGSRVTGALVAVDLDDGERALVRIDADVVFVCAGPTETPSLLRRSGLRRNVGDTLSVHPMLKVLARFPERVDAHQTVLPLLQVRLASPKVVLGGAVYTPGHAALLTSENWQPGRMAQLRDMAAYYVAVPGVGRGRVRPSLLDDAMTLLHYELAGEDLLNLSRGLACLSELLLAAGAEEVLPVVHGLAPIRGRDAAVRWRTELLPRHRLGLTTVHAFSSCPAGERRDRCAADSYGRVHGWDNLYVNDASMLPDSPGANPQATVMALARRNVLHFLAARS